MSGPLTPRLDPSTTDAGVVVNELGVDPGHGLTSAEAARRLASDGPNELRQKPPEPLWRRIVRQFQDPLVYLLFVAMAISLLAWFAEGAEGLPVDVVVVALIVVANALIGFLQESKAESAVAALASMTAVMSTVLRDGRLMSLPAGELVRGDVLVLSEGDSVGADGRLVSATGLRIQESSLTGESEAVAKNTDTLPGKAPIGDRLNMVYKGTAVVQGVGRAVVTSTGMDTEMGAIADMLERTESEPSPLQKEIAQVSKTLGLAVIGIAIVVMVALALLNGIQSASDLVTILLLGVSLAVAAVPEGLPTILSLVLAIGVQALAKRNAVMKDLHSVETLGSASVICSDKTGTLTRNEMTLRTVVTASGTTELSGTGYRPEGEVVGSPSGAAVHEARMTLVGGSMANNAQLRKAADWEIQGDPTEAAFLVALRKLAGAPERVEAYERRAEVPFTSERKLMSVLGEESESGVHRLFTKGAPDVLLTHCTGVQVGPEVAPLDDTRRSTVLAAVQRLSAEGYRTLGVAYKTMDADRTAAGDLDGSDEIDLVFVGVVGIIDPPREEAAAAVKEAHRAGIRTVMITGDHPVTATRIASDLGLVAAGAKALTGAELDQLSDEEFQQATRETSIYARVAPEHKLRIVDALQADRHVVAMTGDGVNDAPALKTADIGVAMGITGTEVTKEAATMILADDNYATIRRRSPAGPGPSSTTSASSCATCCPPTWARSRRSSSASSSPASSGSPTRASRAPSWCPCWPPRSCGSTSSPTPAPPWRWASTPKTATSWHASRAAQTTGSSIGICGSGWGSSVSSWVPSRCSPSTCSCPEGSSPARIHSKSPGPPASPPWCSPSCSTRSTRAPTCTPRSTTCSTTSGFGPRSCSRSWRRSQSSKCPYCKPRSAPPLST